MHFFTILMTVVVVMLHHTIVKGYSIGGLGNNAKPTPYNMGYQAPDGQGNVLFRQEEGDGNGNVRGSYGYKDSQGLYRIVQYTAGADGYQAAIRTNEPGTDGKESPADVQMMVEETPYGIQEQYNRESRMGGGYMLGQNIRKSGY